MKVPDVIYPGSRVIDLLPGDYVTQAGQSAVYIMQSPSLFYRGLQLVAWRLEDGSYSFDNLSPIQVVGMVKRSTEMDRRLRLEAALYQTRRPSKNPPLASRR